MSSRSRSIGNTGAPHGGFSMWCDDCKRLTTWGGASNPGDQQFVVNCVRCAAEATVRIDPDGELRRVTAR